MSLNGRACLGLVDTGCSQTIVRSNLVGKPLHPKEILTVDGRIAQCEGEILCNLVVQGREVSINCLAMKRMIRGVDVILGLDVIGNLGGVHVSNDGASFGLGAVAIKNRPCNESITDEDFEAVFDGKCWTVKWRWKDEVPILKNRVAEYTVKPHLRQEYESEIEEWIQNGWLQETSDFPDNGTLPFMAVQQENKGKVRPVLDYRELNQFVSSHTADGEVCQETLRKWRRMGEKAVLVDLRKAYLQLHVDESLWQFQIVKYKGKRYFLTRLGFGLCSAPKIMSRIVAYVLGLDKEIAKATDHYIDDIIVNTEAVGVEKVVAHLANFGLITKAPEKIDDAKVLGLKVFRAKNGKLV